MKSRAHRCEGMYIYRIPKDEKPLMETALDGQLQSHSPTWSRGLKLIELTNG